MPNGGVPALEDSILLAQGWERGNAGPAPERISPTGAPPCASATERWRRRARLFSSLAGQGYRPDSVAGILASEDFPGDTAPLAGTLDFVCRQVVPRLCQTTDEMELLLAGVEGRFIPPLPGGSPSRGNVHILPTGRNFYAIDPAAVPAGPPGGGADTAGAHCGLPTQKGEPWPESVAIVVYSDECMKTHGEDIARCSP